jgi:tyrosyl-tRNA synthetase
LVTDRTPSEIAALKKEVSTGAVHPMDVKMRLAQEVIAGFHGEEAARKAAENFQRVFRDRQAPVEMEEVRLKRRPDGFLETHTSEAALQVVSPSPKWPQLMKYLSQAESISGAARIIEQGGLEINGKIVKDPMAKLDTNVNASYEVRLGKRKFLRIIVE